MTDRIEEEEAAAIAAAASNLNFDAEDFKNKMKYINVQMDLLSKEDKAKFAGEYKTIGKSLNTLRKVMARKQNQELSWYEFDYYFVGCALLLIILFG